MKGLLRLAVYSEPLVLEDIKSQRSAVKQVHLLFVVVESVKVRR